MLGIFILVVAIVALSTWAARAARERGRSEVAWGAIVALAGVAGFGLGSWLLGSAILDAPLSGDTVLVLAASQAPLLLCLIFMFLAVAVAHRLPPHVSLRGQGWPVHRVPDRSQPGSDGTLVVGREGVRYVDAAGETLMIPRAEVVEAAVDGECLRLRWGERTLVLLPVAGPDNAAWRARCSAMLAERVLRG